MHTIENEIPSFPFSICFFISVSQLISVFQFFLPGILDKAPRLSISIVFWILSSDTETSAITPLGGGARKVLAK